MERLQFELCRHHTEVFDVVLLAFFSAHTQKDFISFLTDFNSFNLQSFLVVCMTSLLPPTQSIVLY